MLNEQAAFYQTKLPLWAKGLLGIVFLYILLSPFYIFQSGVPQPADFLLAVGIGIAFVISMASLNTTLHKVYAVAILFAAYTFLVNILHYLHYPDMRLLLTSLIYIYNVAVFIFISALIRRYPQAMVKILLGGVIISLLVQFGHILFVESEHPFRATGTFNNPNQLAYWALLSAALLIILKYHKQLTLFDYGLIGLAFYMQMVSLSKAGLITFALLILASIVSRAVKTGHKIILMCLIPIIGFFVLFNSSTLMEHMIENDTLQTAFVRILSIGQENDDSLEGRGYDRLVENPLFVILGAGEGAFWRFEQDGHNQELHSGLGTLLFAYGIIGASLFAAFLILIFPRKPVLFTLLLGIIMLFGVTHQNLRFSLLWVFLAAVHATPRIEEMRERTVTRPSE